MDQASLGRSSPPPEGGDKPETGQHSPDLHRLPPILYGVVGPQEKVGLALVQFQALNNQLSKAPRKERAPVDSAEEVSQELLPDAEVRKS